MSSVCRNHTKNFGSASPRASFLYQQYFITHINEGTVTSCYSRQLIMNGLLRLLGIRAEDSTGDSLEVLRSSVPLNEAGSHPRC